MNRLIALAGAISACCLNTSSFAQANNRTDQATEEREVRPADLGWEESAANGTRGAVRNKRVAALAKPKKRQLDTLTGARDILQQERLTITGSRWAASDDQTPPGANSIERDEIEASVSQDLLDLLRRQAGIDLARSGGAGGQTSVFLRGSNSNHVLVLIDGVRVAAAGSGAFQWENLPLEQVERIDIVRGPQASFYGSDAIGGVINIVSRRPSHGGGSQLSARLEVGSHNSQRGEISVSGGDQDTRYWATLAHRQTDGFDATSADSFFNNPDDDGFENTSLSAGYSAAVGSRHRLRASLLSRDATVEFDQGESDNESHQLALQLRGQLSHQLEHTAQFGVVDDELTTPAFGSRFQTRRYELDWQINHGVGSDSVWTFGINAVNESGQSSNEFDDDRDNFAAFVGWELGTQHNRWQLSARHDDNGANTTGRIGWQLELAPRWTMQLSHGTAFRLPNFNELYSPGFVFAPNSPASFAGNAELAAEESQTSELGFVYEGTRSRFGVTGYHNEITNLIAFQGENFAAINIGDADIDGVEVSYSLGLNSWSLDANASWLDARDGSGQALLRRADEKASISVERQFDRGRLGAELIHTGERPDFDKVLDQFTLLNLRGQVELNPSWAVEARLENLADDDYQLASGFNSPGRSAWLGLRWQR